MAGGAFPTYGAPATIVRQRAQPNSPSTPPAGRQLLHPQATWTAPPLPSGSFNPSRTIEGEEANRGLGQLGEGIATKTSQLNADTATSLNEVQRAEQQQDEAFSKAQAQLKESFANLGARQGEQANAAGVLSGGALLQSAAKRAANEAKESATQTTAHNQQKENDALQSAKIIQAQGRTGEALQTELRNAGANNTFFQKSEESLEGQEAAERGYVAPSAPGAVLARAAEQAHGVVPSITRTAGGSFARVGAPVKAPAPKKRK